LAYRYCGKQKSLSIGSYPTVSLADARIARDDAKKLLSKGQDPSVVKRSTTANTFHAIGEEYLGQQQANERASATIVKLKWFLGQAYPVIGGKPVTEITPPEILALLRTVERRKHYETARRLRSVIGRVFRYAIATGRAEADPTQALRGALITPVVKHRAAITDSKAFGGLLRAIDGFQGQPTTTAALKLSAFLLCRPGELRAAVWSEFDLSAAVWTIPAARMKMRRPHKVPLSLQVLSILADLKDRAGPGEYLFPSIRTANRPMSENTLNAALRRLGYMQDEMTAHGFRSTGSTLLNESGNWHADAIERQLAHVDNNAVRRAYARGEFWDERVKMMQWWADYLGNLKSFAKVIPIHSAQAAAS